MGSTALIARCLLFPAPLAALLLWPTSAAAHGIDSEASDKSVLEFVPVGIEHMLLGWDHLLFVAGVVLVAQEVGLAAKMISLFVLGHSTTLITATLAGWQVNANAVDVVIALSVVVVAGVGILKRPERFRLFGAVVLVFGLIHGLGLATRFQDIGIPENGELWRVIAFNVGIEIGQLAAVAAFAALVWLATGRIDTEHHARAAQLACAPIFVGGSIAASLVALNAFTAPPESGEFALPDDTTCEITSPTAPVGDGTGTHPPRPFFEPDEQTPVNDFGHSLGDGYVLIFYPESAEPAEVDGLREFVESEEGNGVLAGPAPTEDLLVLQQQETMTCSEVELDTVKGFSSAWLEQVIG